MADAPVVNLEDDASLAPAAPAPAVEAPPPAVAPVPTEEEPEPDQVDGLLAALRAERAEKKTLKAQAERVGVLEQELNASRPYVDFLKAHPELTRPPQAPSPAPSPTADPKLLTIAKTLDLYKTDGTPDLDRAAQLRAVMREDATEVSQSAVQPLQEMTAQQRSSYNFQQVANLAAPNGVKPDQQVLQQLWSQLPPRLTADPGVAALIHAAAAGFTKQGLPVVAPPAGPPVVTEAQSIPPRRPSVTALDTAVAQHRGQSAEAFAKLAAGFTKGRPSALEDE